MLTKNFKEKIFNRGYNAIGCRMIGGRSNICVMLYLKAIEQTPVCTITSVYPHVDPFNTMLLTCQYGTKLKQSELEGFFPYYEIMIKKARKDFPSHFRT